MVAIIRDLKALHAGLNAVRLFPSYVSSFAIMSLKNELVAIGEASMSGVEINTKEKGIAINIQKVFMDAMDTKIAK